MNKIGKQLNPLRAIIIDDSKTDAAVIIQYLEQAEHLISVVRVETKEEFTAALQEPFDFILADYQNYQLNITYVLTLLKHGKIEKPIIVISEPIGEEKVGLLFKIGVFDFVLKRNIQKISGVIERVLKRETSAKEKSQMQERQNSAEFYPQPDWHTAAVGQWLIDFQRMYVNCSEEVYRIFALDPQRFNRKHISLIPDGQKGENAGLWNYLIKRVSNGFVKERFEQRITWPDGSVHYVQVIIIGMTRDTFGKAVRINGVIQEIVDHEFSERNPAEFDKKYIRQTRELEIVETVSTRLQKATTMKEIIETSLEELSLLLNLNAASFVLKEDDRFSSETVLWQNHFFNQRNVWKSGFFSDLTACTSSIIHITKPEKSDYESLSTIYIDESLFYSSSIVVVPIVQGSAFIGYFILLIKPLSDFGTPQKRIITIIAEMTGISLSRKIALQKLEALVQRREKELECIYNVTYSASARLDLTEALDNAIRKILDAVETPNGAIFLSDDSAPELHKAAGIDDPRQADSLFSFSEIQKTISGIYKNKKTFVDHEILVQNGTKTEDFQKFSFVGFPIKVQDETFGVMALLREESRPFTLDEMTMLSFIADHLALIIKDSRIYKKAEQTAILEERSRLSRELHDSITQSLYSTSLYALGVKRMFENGNYSQIGEYLTTIQETSQLVLKEMRLLVYELRPPELAKEGLIGAIKNRLNYVENRLGIGVDFQYNEMPQIPNEVENNLFRIVAETLNNSLKHAKATRISIRLFCSGHELNLSILDNGVGFNVEEGERNGGFGLSTIKERARMINAQLEIFSSPGSGTKVSIRKSC